MAKTKFDNIKNRVLLVVIVFLLSYLLTALIDKEYTTWFFGGELSFVDYMIDFGVSLLISFVFVELSVFYSSWSFRLVSFTDKPYLRLFICAFLLLLFNNLTVWCFSLLINICFDEGLAFFHQGLYIFSVMATFVSYIYTDAQYMESEVLKSQIDPHFMFNNFSILSELIVEDTALAEKFLDNLSKVYRYVIQNLKRDTVNIEEEITFLHSYIYLIKMRYEDAVCIDIDETLKQIDGQIPPVCLQLLVENAIKHNRASARHPLSIRVFREENDIVVENDLRPIASDFESTGIGNKNIVGRYLLLCKKKPFIEQRENTYIVKLPIINNT